MGSDGGILVHLRPFHCAVGSGKQRDKARGCHRLAKRCCAPGKSEQGRPGYSTAISARGGGFGGDSTKSE